ncbi:MAG: hypothetical protein P1U34_12475 [Coxiellaceae bacterium]|nr:hypothetical protein [Coxiellaceae bacterium]
MSIKAVGKVSAFLISIVAGFLLLLPLSGYFAEAKKATTATKTSLAKSAVKTKAAAGVLCSPATAGGEGSACVKPDQFSVGLFLYLSNEAFYKGQNLLEGYVRPSGAAVAKDVTWYIYLGGVCTLYYTKDIGYNVACIPTQAGPNPPATTVKDIQAVAEKQVFAPAAKAGDNTPKMKYFLGLDIGPSAIDQLYLDYSNKDYSKATSVVVDFIQAYPNTFAGIIVDLEGTGSSQVSKDASMCQAAGVVNIASQYGAEYLSALSKALPNDVMLNVYAGKPGCLYNSEYKWNLWSAVNRSLNTNCVAGNAGACQMGVFIPSIYDLRARSKLSNSVEQFPYQLASITNFANQVFGERGTPGGTPVMAPITVPAGKYGGTEKGSDGKYHAYGYYQLGLAASGSANDSAGYVSFTLGGAPLTTLPYWGPLDYRLDNRVLECTAGDCTNYLQQEDKPGTTTPYKLSSINNQYLCAELNTITYGYSAASNTIPIIPISKGGDCGIVNYKSPSAGLPLTIADLAEANTFPFPQQGYGPMVGVALYQISDRQKKDDFTAICRTDPTKSGCSLSPVFSTIWDTGDNSGWLMFLDWLKANSGDAPQAYIDIPVNKSAD